MHDTIDNNISFVDYLYTNLKYKNKLYQLIEKYEQDAILPQCIVDFNKKYADKFSVTTFRYIYRGEGSTTYGKAWKRNGIFSLKFSVYFNKTD